MEAARLLYDLIEARYCARRDEPDRREEGDAGEKDRVVGRAFGIDRAYHGPVACARPRCSAILRGTGTMLAPIPR